MLKEILTEIGLTSNEAAVYLTCIRFGTQTAPAIAKYSNISRVMVYHTFEGLIKKGLASKIVKGPVTYFQVLNPENLINYLEHDQNEYYQKLEKQKIKIKKILPAIKSLESPTGTKPKVRFFEGEKGVREAYEETLKSSEDLRMYTNAEVVKKTFPDLLATYPIRRKKAGLFLRAICPDNKLTLERKKHNKESFRDMRHVPHKNYSYTPVLFIYEDKLLMISCLEKMAISIQSAELADFHKKMHDLLWSKLEK